MPLLERTRTAGLTWPLLATGVVSALILRSRDFAGAGSPGSGATIALSEIVSRVPVLAHAAMSVGERALWLLLRVALAPLELAWATLSSEFHLAGGVMAELGSILHTASAYFLNAF